MTKRVIDASTLLAFLQGEFGANEAGRHCVDSFISAVNLSEVFRTAMRQNCMPIVQAIVQQAAIDVVPFTHEQAVITAELHRATGGKNISLADCACMALGMMMKLPVITWNCDWQDLDVGIELICLGRK